MFGTLNPKQHKEPLTFVENTDRAYPGREVRRRKLPASRQIETPKPSSGMSSSKPTAENREQSQVHGRGQSHSQGQGPEQTSVGLGSGQSEQNRPHTADASVGIRDLDMTPDQCQQQMKQWLSSYSVGDGSSSGSVLDGHDEWLGMDSFLCAMTTPPLENLDGSVDIWNETMEGSLSGDADSLTGFDDIDQGILPSSFPNADNLAHPLMPSNDVASPLTSIIPPTSSQTSAPGTDINNKGHGSLLQTPTILNNVQSTPRTSNPIPTLGLHSKSPVHPAALPGLTNRDEVKDGCSCLNLAACLLEELGAESARSDPASMDLLLGSLRWALVRCTSILDCERCTSLSDNNMLLAMVGRYMSNICERIVMCYIELQRAQDQRQTRQQPSTSPLLADGNRVSGYSTDENGGSTAKSGVVDADDIWFSTYRLDNGSERMQVLQCLAGIQLSEFSRLLEKLQARAGSRQGHLVLLTEADKRIKAVRSMLRDQLNRPPSEKTL
ncbi:MAG: hypothetical protein Q9209_005301 [Squamulea sp. 1 TL-2023]